MTSPRPAGPPTADPAPQRSLKILQVTPFFQPHAGGVEAHVRSISEELARRGHAVTVLTSRYDRSLPASESRDGYEIRRSRTWGVALDTPIDVGTRAAIRAFAPDVVHLHYPPPLTSYFAVRGLKGRSVPVCLTYHCDLYRPGIVGRLLTAIYEGLFLSGTLDRAGRIVVHTRSYAETSGPLRGRRTEVIPSMVDLDRFQPSIEGGAVRERLGLRDRRVLLFTGRLVPHKGVDLLLRALPSLPEDVALVVVGRGPELDGLRGLARRLGVSDRVRFCPEVSDRELPSYLRAADLFVFPSQNRLEGFGLAVAEAMASGLPVVIADMPGVREVIDPGVEGLLVEPLIASDLVARITELLDDPGRRARMGAAGRRRAEARYGQATVVDALLRVYGALAEAG
ncbi:MAG TPA: glycosyltransferase family 4 protein [Thermoplasmata archaeon]|nr:glycosyltransferase family 4 protein [Thermoplasmata archaeon]